MSVTIIETAFDPEGALRDFRLSLDDVGAVVSFTGVVRAGGHDDLRLILSHYPAMTRRAIEGYGAAATARWPLTAWRVIHRVGDMRAGEPIVFVATASAHRRAAFEGADFLMDHLKSQAPFWKQERVGSASRWIEPRGEDQTDLARWSDKGDP